VDYEINRPQPVQNGQSGMAKAIEGEVRQLDQGGSHRQLEIMSD